tara:strand:- start:3490 stop:3912 length:423 start_codon:yes stop_codon:yes gene_type:complete
MIFSEKVKNIKKIKLKDLIFFEDRSKTYNWKDLEDSLNNGYSPKKYDYIKVNNDGVVVNGNHRCIILNKKYGDEFEVEISKIDGYGKKTFLFIFIFVFPFYLLAHLFEKIFIKRKNKMEKKPIWGFWIAQKGILKKEFKI